MQIDNVSERGNRDSAAWPDGRRCAVSISFDDGKASQLHLAVPALGQRQMRATFYLTTERLETVKPSIRKDITGRWAAILAEGHEIGNHTRTHPCSTNFAWTQNGIRALEDLTNTDLQLEIDEVQRFIESEIGPRPKTFAYPCGMTFTGRGAQRQSYVPLVARAFVVGRGFNDECAASPTRCDLAYVPAMSMDCKSAVDLKALVDASRDAGSWLILVGHGVGRTAAPYMTDLSAFEHLLDYLLAQRADVWVDTVERIGSYLAKRR